MNVLMTALGSAGDVHPVLGVGSRLRDRGHQVTVVASAYFEPLIRRTGFDCVPLGTVDEFQEVMQNPDLWDSMKGFKLVAQWGIVRYLRELYEIVTERYEPGKTVVVAHSLDLSSRIAQEKLGVPVATMHLAPCVFRSAELPPVLPPMITGPWIPKWMIRAQYWIGDRTVIDPLVAPEVNRLRASLGLSPVRRLFDRWWFSPQRVIGLFPDWFAPIQSDWPQQTVLTGFPLWDESGVTEMPEECEKFLAEGEPPIVFTPGSANLHGHDFFVAAADACEHLRRRGILLTRHPQQLPKSLPESVRHFDYVPLSQVLPRCAAFVHHAGVGSLSQGLAAGVPHLTMPLAHDQYDNTARLMRLGVADTVAPKHFSGAAVAVALDRLLGSGEVKKRCAEYAERLRGHDAIGKACEQIEALGESQNSNG